MGSKPTVCGVGVNDADYKITNTSGGVRTICPFYRCWQNMLDRCYSNRHYSYNNCYVCDEWLVFSKFKAWMSAQDYLGKELEKDLLIENNMIYSPDGCTFVPKPVNRAIVIPRKTKNPFGVCWDETKQNFLSYIDNGKKRVYLGRCHSEINAHRKWQLEKIKQLETLAGQFVEQSGGLLRISRKIKEDFDNEEITRFW